ncbi:MAG: hypothetical protein ACPGTO_10950, partial [Polaribacter sp.]
PQSTIEINGDPVPSVNLIGNVIQNANTHNLNTTLNFGRFYKELGVEKWLNTKREKLNRRDTIQNKKYRRVPY